MEDHGAFVEKFELRPPPLQSSTAPLLCLSGLTFSVKEMFDISGRVTGFGNPEWARTHPPATTTSPTILALLQAGAVCVGRTVMDEMAYSINGENKHYGTPINPCAKDRVPGGSSSGSAVSVAAKLVDFSLGTDTGGSVRVPASYCGIFGIRPSHGAVDSTGVIPMAQSFDCVGWFSRDATILAGVGDVLLPPSASANHMPTRVLVPDDCFQLLSSSIGRQCEIFSNSIGRVVGELVHLNLREYIKDKVPSLNYFLHRLSKAGVLNLSGIPELSVLAYAMQTLQRFEFKANHEDWVDTVRPDLGPGTSERVWEAINFADLDAIPHCISLKSQLRTALNELLKDDAVLLLPTVPGPPPKLNTDVSLLKDFRSKAFGLLSIAGISGLCQITIPLGMVDDLPASISVLASHGRDRFLLEFVKNFFSSSAKVDTAKL